MGRLALIANRITRIEQAFLKDDVQAMRNELNSTLALLNKAYPETEIREVYDRNAFDGPEPWL